MEGNALTSILPVVLCVIENQQRMLLLNRRKPPYAGYWSLPGGKVHPGESVMEAAEREAFEETSIRARAIQVSSVVSESIHHYETGDLEHHFLLFIVELASPCLSFRASEEGDLEWFSSSELPENLIETDRLLLDSCLTESARIGMGDHLRVLRDGERFMIERIERIGLGPSGGEMLPVSG